MRQPKPRTPRVPATGTRRIVVNGATWRWAVGKGNVSLWSPDGVRHNAHASTIKGITPDVYDRGKWKRTSDGSVCPSHVRAYIEGLR